MVNKPIASSLLMYPDIVAFNDMLEQRFADIDLSVIMVYLIDTAPVNVLPYLAEQFDCLGVKGWKFADTEQKQRDLLKSTLQLRKYKGTVWAVENSLTVLGFNNVEVQEGIGGITHNGQISRDGTNTRGGGITHNGTIYRNGQYQHSFVNTVWATFRVIVGIDGFGAINVNTIADVIALIKVYKNKRSRLIDVSFKSNIEESVELTEDFQLQILS